jgi:hypothetical protein
VVKWTDADEITPPPDSVEVYTALIPRVGGRSVSSTAAYDAFLSDNLEFGNLREQVASDVSRCSTRTSGSYGLQPVVTGQRPGFPSPVFAAVWGISGLAGKGRARATSRHP